MSAAPLTADWDRVWLAATCVRPRILCAVFAVLGVVAASGYVRSADTTESYLLRLNVYVRGDSELCRDAVGAAEKFCKSRGGIELGVYDVVADPSALDAYWRVIRQYQVPKAVLPAFYACRTLKLGFDKGEGDERIAELFAVHAYIRPNCQHCRDAKSFLTGLAKRWPAIRVVFHDVEHDAQARKDLMALARSHGRALTSLPAILICGRIFTGYLNDATTGREIEELLRASSTRSLNRTAFHRLHDSPPDQETAVIPDESASSAAIQGSSADGGVYALPEQAPEEVELPWIGQIRLRDLGLPLFTITVGLIDGFNPCAMWVLVFLLSVLVNVKDRRKILAIAGTFVLVSGVAYYAFMAAWLNLFMFITLVRPLQIAIGVLALFIGVVNIKDFFAFKQGLSLSIPESAKPRIYDRVRRIVAAEYLAIAIGMSVVLAVVVNVVELLCTAGLPAIYTQILSQQHLPSWKNYAYLALYIAGYMFDDTLMVGGFIITLSHRKMRETEGRWLKLISGLVVMALGLVVLFKPDWLQWGN